MTKAAVRKPARQRASTRPRTEPSDTEARILAAARVVFTRAGTAGARMQDIAREAGVNQALLHYYFRSKQALADRVFVEAASTLFAALPRGLDADTPLDEFVTRFVHAYIETIRRTPFIPAYVATETHADPERVAGLMATVLGHAPRAAVPPFVTLLQRQIDRRAARGEMRAMDATQLLVTCMALVAFPFVAHGLLQVVFDFDRAGFDAFLDARRDDLPRFILNALRP